MNELACAAMNLSALLLQKSMAGVLTEYEAQLYEAAARYSASVLKFTDVTMQSSLIEEGRRLDELRNPDSRGTNRVSA